jgi:hypothetical protein
MDAKNRRHSWLMLIGVLLLLAAAAWLIVRMLPEPEVSQPVMSSPRTTIRITKGRPGVSTSWNVESSGTTTALSALNPVPPTLWQKMNGTIASFRHTRCDGSEEPVMELRYRTQSAAGGISEVHTSGTVGSSIRWDFSECGVATMPCTFPGRYFDPTYYPAGESPCTNPSAQESWAIVLQ